MAAASCSGETATRKSNHPKKSKRTKRIIAARAFLKSITFNGITYGEDSFIHRPTELINASSRTQNGPISTRVKVLRQQQDSFDEDEELISALQNTSRVQLHHSTSVACTNIFEEGVSRRVLLGGGSVLKLLKSQSCIDASSLSSSGEKQQGRHDSSIHLVEPRQYLRRLVKNMVQKRTLLTSSNAVPFGSFSIIPYRKIEKPITKDRRISGVTSQTSAGLIAIEGVEVGDGKRTVSYSHMLVPAIFARRRLVTEHGDSIEDVINLRDHQDSVFEPAYHPFLLDDPELTIGKHRKVLNLKSYTVSVIQYAKSSEIKKNINETFKEKFPNSNITLSKLRSIKVDMLEIGVKCGIDKASIACSHVYFEKLVLKGKINKINRKYCAGACLLLACKFYEDIKKGYFSSVIEVILDKLRLHLKELLACELLVLIALEFSLCLPAHELNPMYKRLENIRHIVKSRNPKDNHHHHRNLRQSLHSKNKR